MSNGPYGSDDGKRSLCLAATRSVLIGWAHSIRSTTRASSARVDRTRVYPEHVKRGETVIEVDPAILSGTPVFAGTRVPAQALLEYLERGRSLAEFLADFPTVTQDQAVAALEEAKDVWLARARVPAESIIDLLDSWLDEDSKREGGAESWEQLKRNLDRDRLSSRPLFP